MAVATDPALIASELRVVLGQLVRRLRAEHHIPLPQATVLGRLDRCGPASTSELASAEHMRPQSMAQTVAELEAEGFVVRRPDPGDRRRAVAELTAAGRAALETDRSARVGWLAHAVETELTPSEQRTLWAAVGLLRRMAER